MDAAGFVAEEPRTPEAAASQALVLVSSGAAKEALIRVERWREQASSHYWVMHAFVRAYSAVGEHARAEQVVRNYLEHCSTDSRAWHDLGRLSLERSQFADACSALAEGVALENAGTQLWSDFGAALIAVERVGHAIRALRRALRIDDRNVLAVNNLAVCYLRRGDPRKATAYLREALVLQPGFTVARNNLSELFIARGAFAESLALLDEATDPIALEHKAWCYIKRGRQEKAKKLLTLAIDQSGYRSGVLMNNLAMVHLSTGDPRTAESLFSAAGRLEPDQPTISTNFARLLLVSEKCPEPWHFLNDGSETTIQPL